MNNNDNTKKFGIEKMPPQNVDAEQTLLCSLLIDKDVILKVVDIVNEHDFYKNSHRYIFEAMKDLYAKNEPIDILTLTNKLKEREQLEKIGGRTYLAHLSNVSATSAHAENYAEIIQKKATLRRLIKAAKRITELGYDENEEVDKLLDEAEQNLFKVSQAYSKTQFISIDNLLSDAFERIDDLHKNGSKKSGLTSGYPDLDRLLTGFQKSDLIIIAARPSVGKTTFALDIARKVAITNKSSIALFSLEMSKEQLVDRLLCAESNVSLWKMRSGKLSDKENDNDFEKIGLGMGKLSEAPIFIDDSPGCSIMDVRSKARRLQVEKGLDMIIIDYLQLMEGRGNKNDNRVQEIAEISRGLKGIARELNIPVIALSQLSRAVESIKPAIPKLAHLRDSGTIEQDADIVMFIYRKASDRNYNRNELPPEERYKGEIHVAKHRNGPTGQIDLFFDEESVSFKNITKPYIEDK